MNPSNNNKFTAEFHCFGPNDIKLVRLLGNTSSYGTLTMTTFYKEGQLWLNLTTFQIGQPQLFSIHPFLGRGYIFWPIAGQDEFWANFKA